MDVEQRLRAAEENAQIARDRAADVQVFRQATEEGIHRLSGESMDLANGQQNLEDRVAGMDATLGQLQRDCQMMLPTAMFILNGVGQGYMESGFGLKASDENPNNGGDVGYYRLTLEQPTNTYNISITPLWAGVSWGAEIGSVGVLWLSSTQVDITCFGARIDGMITKRPHKLSVIVW